ncbi:outer membrane beta-barrel domain-containing protein [Geomonas sp. RF6]|uniref:outer membrane beta-barrel domain-containing protein n=1 Tax=Geomonas sp. RF6 TaxID=2897342 RepID=UPI001E52C990|nr:outer membrane beta-barrel domain-containing protein [Geomonas sp. RF6]UFS72666.1 outer membrane beta-barrel domain-containing protein [Geomonas sp. RF6]
MKKVVSSVLMAAAITAVAQPVFAGERAGALSVSPFVGGYTFDGEQHLKTAPVYGLRLGYDITKNLGVEAVGDYLSSERTRGGERSVNAVSYRLDLLYNFLADGPLVPYLAAGGGGMTIGHGGSFDNRDGNELLYSNSGRNTAATANVGGGLKYFLTDSVALRGDVRQLFVFGEKTMYNWEYTAGLSFLFGGEKAVPAPAPAPAAAEKAASVPPPAAVPTASLSVAPSSIRKGESATLKWTSQNATDCSIAPEVGAVRPQGSMTVTPAGDTSYTLSCNGPGGSTTSAAQVAIALPVAPPAAPAPKATLTATPASVSRGESAKLQWSSQNATNCDVQPGVGPVKTQGEMSVTPSDNTAYTLTCNGDGGTVHDTANISVVAPAPPAPKAEELCVTLDINFITGKAAIPAQYRPELEKVANFMKTYPQVKGVIEGHTDNVGSKAMNDRLSLRRAQSVKDYLVKEFGIDPSRLQAKGYGFSKPVASNATAEGRRNNRRIVANFDCVQK